METGIFITCSAEHAKSICLVSSAASLKKIKADPLANSIFEQLAAAWDNSDEELMLALEDMTCGLVEYGRFRIDNYYFEPHMLADFVQAILRATRSKQAVRVYMQGDDELIAGEIYAVSAHHKFIIDADASFNALKNASWENERYFLSLQGEAKIHILPTEQAANMAENPSFKEIMPEEYIVMKKHIPVINAKN